MAKLARHAWLAIGKGCKDCHGTGDADFNGMYYQNCFTCLGSGLARTYKGLTIRKGLKVV